MGNKTEKLGRFGRLKQTLLENRKIKKNNISLNNEGTTHKKSIPTTIVDKNNNIFISQIIKDEKQPSEPSENKRKRQLILDWLLICLEEGHIEPSQPCTGRILGWPKRAFLKNSLYTDFKCRCLDQKIPEWKIPSNKHFYSITDKIFTSKNDSYLFPSLQEFRKKMHSIIQEYYYSDNTGKKGAAHDIYKKNTS